MAIGFFLTAFYLIQSLLSGRRAPANPWGGKSLEWQCASPPPHDNFSKQPTVGDCYDFSDVVWDEQEQGYVIKPELAKKGGH
jgi:cytochrome c oxidase subunit 1